MGKITMVPAAGVILKFNELIYVKGLDQDVARVQYLFIIIIIRK